jgi:hypothetical protein
VTRTCSIPKVDGAVDRDSSETACKRRRRPARTASACTSTASPPATPDFTGRARDQQLMAPGATTARAASI